MDSYLKAFKYLRYIFLQHFRQYYLEISFAVYCKPGKNNKRRHAKCKSDIKLK